MAEKSLQEAEDEVHTLPDKGEVIFLPVGVMLHACTYVVRDD